jgi:hypothetical protein
VNQELELLARSNERQRHHVEKTEAKVTQLEDKLRAAENRAVDLSDQITALTKQNAALLTDRQTFEANYSQLEEHLSAIRSTLLSPRKEDDTVSLGEYNRLVDKFNDLQTYLATFGEALDVAVDQAPEVLPHHPAFSSTEHSVA